MKTFVDTQGRTWSITLNLGAAMKIRDRLGVDLLQPELGDPPLLTRLGTDELLLGEVICNLLESQFDVHKVTAEDIYNAFDGKTLQDAQEAFYQEMIHFFRQSGRTDRAQAIEKQRKMIEAGIKAVETRLNQLDETTQVEAILNG
ncbi:MAG: hypothetical protein PHQ75_01435 [Thermoguttaceae bacterium]|nr:hypothetical protein [Thermoguttaceae bacterium]